MIRHFEGNVHEALAFEALKNEKEIFDFPQINDMLNDLKKIKTKVEIRKKILTPDYKIRMALFD